MFHFKVFTFTSPPTIALTAAPSTANQLVCINTPITPIRNTVGNGATGVSIFPNLPTGITGSFFAGIFTISGTPTVSGVFPYTVTTSRGDGSATLSGTITVFPQVTLFCDALLFPNSAGFDWNPIGGIRNYNYSYSINGGPLVSGSTMVSNFQVLDVLPWQSVTFTLLIDQGLCQGTY